MTFVKGSTNDTPDLEHRPLEVIDADPDVAELFTPFFADLTDPRLWRAPNAIACWTSSSSPFAPRWETLTVGPTLNASESQTLRLLSHVPGTAQRHPLARALSAASSLALDPAQLMACIQQCSTPCRRGRRVAIDGKTLRGSFDTAAGKNPLHLVSAWACDGRLTLGQGVSPPNRTKSRRSPCCSNCWTSALVVAYRRHGLPERDRLSHPRPRRGLRWPSKTTSRAFHDQRCRRPFWLAEDGFTRPKAETTCCRDAATARRRRGK